MSDLAADVPATVATIERWFTGLLDEHELEAFLAALRTLRAHVRPDATAGAHTDEQTSITG